MDDVDLPPILSSTRQTTPSRPRPTTLLTRKRTHPTYDDDPATSSDPALFSSDEHAPDAENYASGKRKKYTYRGSWWDHQRVNSTKSKKREFRRNFDSGVFMGSETSDEGLSSDSLGLEDELLRDQGQMKRGSRPSPLFTIDSVETTPRAKTVSRPALSAMSSEHDAVCRIVGHALDNGKEDIDLSAMSLSTLPSEISSLNTLSKNTEIVTGMLDVGTDLEAKLRLYMANNRFVQFPTPILDLRNLRVLSLRQNKLTSIPPAIRELVNLESLNIGGNSLQELPFEIVELARFHSLRNLTTDPNPFNIPRPYTAPSLERLDDEKFESPPDSQIPALYRRKITELQFESKCKINVSASTLGVPSLRELALRKMSQLDPMSQIDFREIMPDDSPESILEDLSLLKTQPSRRCTRCHRTIVLAAQQWMEWWRLPSGTGEPIIWPRAYVPFKRLLCSADCPGEENSWCGEPTI